MQRRRKNGVSVRAPDYLALKLRSYDLNKIDYCFIKRHMIRNKRK